MVYLACYLNQLFNKINLIKKCREIVYGKEQNLYNCWQILVNCEFPGQIFLGKVVRKVQVIKSVITGTIFVENNLD